MGSFNKKCFKIKLAVKGIKKTTWEPGSKSVIAPNEMNFFVCEKDGQQIRVARQAMDESEKVSILYIDEYYPIEEKLFDFRYIIATIKIKKK